MSLAYFNGERATSMTSKKTIHTRAELWGANEITAKMKKLATAHEDTVKETAKAE